MPLDYSTPGTLTMLDDVPAWALEPVGHDPVAICAPVHALVLQPSDPFAASLEPERQAENQIRPAGVLVARLLALDPSSLDQEREPGARIIGTCRHFAVLGCALLRLRGIPARVRCGFATYFQPEQGLDHWIVEYLDDRGTWVRMDPEVMGQDVIERPEHLTPQQFLTGGEAWSAFRRGEIDASRFGVYGTQNWGPGEIRGNAVKDLAALNKLEVLPWDEWGRMTDAYENRTGADYDELLDTLATVCADDDTDAVADLFRHDDLRVPDSLIG